MTKPKLDFWYEFASPYAYLAALSIENKAKAAGVEVVWRPFLLGAIFKMMKLPALPMQISPQKEAYMWMDASRQARRQGFLFRKPDQFPQSSVLPSRVALVGFKEGWGEDFSRRVYAANFAHNQLISDVQVISQILADMGKEPEKVLALATSPANKKALMVETQTAFDKGIFGVPTFFVGNEMFWGNDQMLEAFAIIKGNR